MAFKAGILIGVLAFGVAAPAQAKVVTVDVPGATNTSPQAINAKGWIAGGYDNGDGITHSFVRTNKGTITTFDVDDRGTPGGRPCDTFATSINDKNVIVGTLVGCNGLAFIRQPDGTVTTFRMSSAETIFYPRINNKGEITGTYLDDPLGRAHAFVRARNGKIKIFDAPGTDEGTYARCINDSGVIAGHYRDTNGVRGFVRTAKGKITPFDAPDAINTYVYGLNSLGDIAGYEDTSAGSRGFVRKADGTFATIDLPKSEAHSVNDSGVISGISLTDAARGFVKTADGKFKTVDPKDSAGVVHVFANDKGKITGSYHDAAGLEHGFFGTP